MSSAQRLSATLMNAHQRAQRQHDAVSLIRFGGHLPKGEYDVDHDGDEGQADAAELHG